MIALLVLLAGAFAARSALWYQTTDFFCLYQGAHALAVGVDPYDETAWNAAAGGLYPDPRGGLSASSCPGRYGYPLWSAVALLPIGILPIEIASSLWMALSIGAAVLGIAAAWSALGGTPRYAGVFAACVVMSQPFWILLISGQLSGVTLGLAGLVAWAIAHGRERTGGIALALLALKPQTSAITIPVVFIQALLQRRRPLAISALVAGALMVIVPLLFVPAWPLEWLDEVTGRRLRVVTLLPTAWGFAADTLGDPRWGAVFLAVVVVATVLLARGRADPLLVFVLSLPISLLATPYAWTYDYLVLALAWGFIFARAGRSEGATRAMLVVAGLVLAVLAPWTLYLVSFMRGEEALSATLAAATAIVVALAARARPLEGLRRA